jgi:MurNAc alpha-1-phosphate uridylyltransferase
MKAMILAAGRGTRLAPLTDTTPKPLLPVHGKPLIEWQLAKLREAGFTDVVINLHHLGEQVEAFVGTGERFGVRTEYSRETSLLETGGGIVNALPLLGPDPFVVLNGDILTDFDFATLPTTLDPQVLAHLVLTPTPSQRRTGDFQLEGNRVIARGDDYVYCGIAIMCAGFYAAAPSGAFSWTVDHFFHLIGELPVTAQVFEGAWVDIGSIEQYEALE